MGVLINIQFPIKTPATSDLPVLHFPVAPALHARATANLAGELRSHPNTASRVPIEWPSVHRLAPHFSGAMTADFADGADGDEEAASLFEVRNTNGKMLRGLGRFLGGRAVDSLRSLRPSVQSESEYPTLQTHGH